MEPALNDADELHLRRALELAERGRRTVAPNPVVGAVLVNAGRVIGEGWHVRRGGPHAEVAALASAREDPAGATLYVTLEPCAHRGRTPPCVDAVLAARIARVVVAALDPNPEVDGKGVARLRAAGVHVDLAGGELELAARIQNAPFRTRIALGRAHVTYKAAASLDGRVATAGGESRWISSPESRRLVHRLRAEAGAVAVGIGTALADDPLLTAREADPRAERQPLRVVFDRAARLPLRSRLATSVDAGPVLVVCAPGAPGRAALEAAGLETLPAAAPEEALRALATRGVDSVLLEGGPRLAASLLAAGLVDRLIVFLAPLLLGEGPGLLAGWGAGTLAAAPRLLHARAAASGPDILVTGELREPI